MASFSSYPDWKAPAQDAQTTIWPEPGVLLEQTLATHGRLQSDTAAKMQGIPLAQVRQRQRQLLQISDDQPVIATGHQTELIHPGVWAKNALLSAAAKKIDARSIHFSVDTDAPKHLHLRWPGGGEPITDDPGFTTVPWSGLLNEPTPAHLRTITAQFNAASREWSFQPMIPAFLSELGRLAIQPGKLPPLLVSALQTLDESLGLRQQIMITSPLWAGDPYLVFVHHLLARAGGFARVYNDALHQYRVAHRLRTTARPMPDLVVSDAQCEVPFWLDDLKSELRSRATVHRQDGGWKLVVPGGEFILKESLDGWQAAAALNDFLNQHGLRLSPRALTLTAFIRVLIADQFVHGIGGGRYDQVTDLVIERFFGIEPPNFSVTTATLFFPAAVGRARACLPCLLQQGHHLRHQLLGEGKKQLLEQIQSFPRKSYQRRQIFSEMHNQLATALVTHPSIRQWEEAMVEATRQSKDEQSLFDRELFYAIQPRERLEMLIGEYARQFESAGS